MSDWLTGWLILNLYLRPSHGKSKDCGRNKANFVDSAKVWLDRLTDRQRETDSYTHAWVLLYRHTLMKVAQKVQYEFSHEIHSAVLSTGGWSWNDFLSLPQLYSVWLWGNTKGSKWNGRGQHTTSILCVSREVFLHNFIGLNHLTILPLVMKFKQGQDMPIGAPWLVHKWLIDSELWCVALSWREHRFSVNMAIFCEFNKSVMDWLTDGHRCLWKFSVTTLSDMLGSKVIPCSRSIRCAIFWTNIQSNGMSEYLKFTKVSLQA